jgi:RHS repeat-associated protein
LEEVDQSGAVLALYTRTQYINEVIAQRRSGTTSYYQFDGLGSSTSLSNSAGALANTYSYDSFGNTIGSVGSLANPFRFAGREFDTESGIYQYRTRYYDPGQGRFISEDASGFQGGLNFCKYVQNNPLVLTDPTGLSPQGAGGGTKDLWCYFWGDPYCNNYHSNDGVTADLANSAAMADIRRKFINNHCASGVYCGAFGPKQVATTWNFVGQAVGGFCAHMTNLGDGETQVDAYNDWGCRFRDQEPNRKS